MIGAAAKPVPQRCHCGVAGAFGYRTGGRWRWFCAQHRLREWSADACVDEIESARATAELFAVELADPPDLQALVAKHGGYDKISAVAWAEYDRAMAAYQLVRRERYRKRR